MKIKPDEKNLSVTFLHQNFQMKIDVCACVLKNVVTVFVFCCFVFLFLTVFSRGIVIKVIIGETQI